MGADYYKIETGVFRGKVLKCSSNIWSTILSNSDNYDIYLSVFNNTERRICWLILSDKESFKIDLKTDVVGPYDEDGSFVYYNQDNEIRFLSASVLGIIHHTDFSMSQDTFLDYYDLN